MKQFYLIPLSLILISQGFAEEAAFPSDSLVASSLDKKASSLSIANLVEEDDFDEDYYESYRASKKNKKAAAEEVAVQEESEELDQDFLTYGEEVQEVQPEQRQRPQRRSQAQAPQQKQRSVAQPEAPAIANPRQRATAQQESPAIANPRQPRSSAQADAQAAPRQRSTAQAQPRSRAAAQAQPEAPVAQPNVRVKPQQKAPLKAQAKPQIADSNSASQKQQMRKNSRAGQVRPQIADDDGDDEVPTPTPPQPVPQPTPPPTTQQRPNRSYQRPTNRQQNQNQPQRNRRAVSQEQTTTQTTTMTTTTVQQKPDMKAVAETVNMPARPMLNNGYDFWIMGDALYWQAVEDNLEYVNITTPSTGTLTHDIIKPHFQWDWGFRVGTGYNAPRDGWDVGFTWLRMTNTAKGSASGTVERLFTLVTPGTYTSASTKWHMQLNQADLFLGREFFAGHYLTIRPSVGVRTAWLKQTMDIDYVGAAAVQSNDLKSRYWGFGFNGGLDTDWKFGAGFSLFGKAAYSILMGFFDVDMQETATTTPTSHKVEKSFRSGKPILDLELGFKWAHSFGDSFGLTLKAGYEYHVYFNQNQFVSDTNYAPVGGDLSYQGLTLSGQFDF